MIAEKIVETKSCRICSASFDITDKDREFYEKVSPTFSSSLEKEPVLNLIGEGESGNNPLIKDLGDGKIKYLIPTPALCPDCRQQRRLSFRNERKLYHRKCDLTGKQIISIYSPDKPHKVYEQSAWWSDGWDPLEYGCVSGIDFSRPFFEQVGNLIESVPQMALFASNNENSEYTNFSETEKNCYLVFASNRNENCFYSSMIWDSVYCMDCCFLEKSQNCYELVNATNCFSVYFSEKIYNSTFCSYVFDCEGCHYCFGCTGLRNKSYYILNKPFKKEEYFKIINNSEKIKEIITLFFELKAKQFRLYEDIKDCENVTGGGLMNCKNCTNCFTSFGLENSKFTENSPGKSNNVYDVSGCTSTSLSYELGSIAHGYKMLFSGVSYLSSDHQMYCFHCHNSSHLFGCISLRNASYCILNKQYTKEAYETLVPRIIKHMMKTGEWGEFFPSFLSPFGYNETVANEYYPIESLQLSVIGQQTNTFKLCKLKTGNGELKINWSDYEKQNGYDGVFYIPLEIEQYDENMVGKEIAEKNIYDLLQGILQCEVSKKPFKIIKQELEFYIKLHISIPRRSSDQRYIDRMKLTNPHKLWARKCDECGKEIQTTYAPERPEIVYCGECYNKAMY